MPSRTTDNNSVMSATTVCKVHQLPSSPPQLQLSPKTLTMSVLLRLYVSFLPEVSSQVTSSTDVFEENWNPVSEFDHTNERKYIYKIFKKLRKELHAFN